jgi:hypothetical protein
VNNNQPKSPSMFVWYESVNGVRVPKFLVPAESKHAAQEMLKAQDHTMGHLAPVEEADPADLIRLVLPSLTMQLMSMTQLLGIVAQDAQERLTERAKGRLNIVRGS